MEEKLIPAVVAGGDLRQVYAANELCRRGYSVTAVGFKDGLPFEKGVALENSLTALANAKLLLLPLGMTKGDLLNTPLYDGEFSFADCLAALSTDCAVFGGNITQSEREVLAEHNFTAQDYFKVEELTIANAVLTAEGALELALRELPVSLWRSRCLILGYGRIGKALAARLKAFGAKVTVAARSGEQRAWAKAEGLKAVALESLPDILPYQQVLFNTIPQPVLTEELLELAPEEQLLIELASKPYGIDFSAAERLGKKAILASGLPGKCCPKSAGELIAQTVLNMKP